MGKKGGGGRKKLEDGSRGKGELGGRDGKKRWNDGMGGRSGMIGGEGKRWEKGKERERKGYGNGNFSIVLMYFFLIYLEQGEVQKPKNKKAETISTSLRH